jgi:hypothetical protein
MMLTTAIQWLSWLIAGSIAAWLVDEIAGRGPLGHVADWLVGLTGALLTIFLVPVAVWLVSLPFDPNAEPLDWGQSVETLSWWYAVPLAFTGGLLLSAIYRRLSRVHAHPSP